MAREIGTSWSGELYEKQSVTTNQDNKVKGRKTVSFDEIFEKVRQKISNENAEELATVLYSPDAEYRIKDLINAYLLKEKLTHPQMSKQELINTIYEGMAGFGFLEKYLRDEDVEEININSKDSIWVHYPNRKFKISETYATADDCIHAVKKLARNGGLILDQSVPSGDSYVSKGVRMTAAIYPAVGPEEGGIASIRKQKPSFITREKLIEFETATEDELDFLIMCINNGVSIVIAGETGSGKTADMNFILNNVNPDYRIVTIEDTKELQPTGDDVVQLYTQEKGTETMAKHLKSSLRLHPKILVPAEMRGEEAKTAVEAARTGHTSLTSIHANGAKEAYTRMLTMYRQADAALSEDMILKMIIEAFPIAVFKKQLPDKSRKYIEIFEAREVENGNVSGNTLFKFKTLGAEREGDKITKITGQHEQIGGISDRLYELMKLNGVSEENLEKYRRKE